MLFYAMRIDSERLIHSLKTAIACVIAFFVAKLVRLPADQWIVITVIVVMCAQLYVGSVLQKAYLRFLGTLLGCLLAAATLATFGATNLAIITTLAIASFGFSYIATSQESLSYAGSLGAVTTTIILLGQEPTVIFALERFIEISLGILIASLTSQFILPIHARTHLRHAQAATLQQLHDYYATTLMGDQKKANAQELDEEIVNSILRQRQLAKDSVREPLLKKFDPEHFMLTLQYERELLRTMTFMQKAYSNIDHSDTELTSFNQSVLQALRTLNQVVVNKKLTDERLILPNTQTIQINNPSVYTNSFIFLAGILVNTLGKLGELYQIPVH